MRTNDAKIERSETGCLMVRYGAYYIMKMDAEQASGKTAQEFLVADKAEPVKYLGMARIMPIVYLSRLEMPE